jgi:diguanylate cyclase (GGDEF)-like protein
MLRTLIKCYGVIPATLALTATALLSSATFTFLIDVIFLGSIELADLTISIIVPALVAPPFTYQILRLIAQLEAAEEQQRILAITDPLTQAYNRRHFVALSEREFARAKRYGTAFSLIILDIDDFKPINDSYGHAAGDEVLRRLTAICQAACRDSDLFARYGGEEFIFLLPETDKNNTLNFAERLRKLSAQTTVTYNQAAIHFTVSMGVITYQQDATGPDALLIKADEALYQAKHAGKNRVMVA